MEKLYYSISEVAEILQENTSLVRYWANSFPEFIKPKRNAKGNRLFTNDDVENFKTVHHLVNNEGLTLEGVQKRMSNAPKVAVNQMKILSTLKSIREDLNEIRKSIK